MSTHCQLSATATRARSTGSGVGKRWRVGTANCHAVDTSQAAPMCRRRDLSVSTTALMVSV